MREIFVFGSNLAGIHGAGSAAEALKNHGAKYNIGVGLQGNSYAIPTKDHSLNVLPLKVIYAHVKEFLQFAKDNADMHFTVVKIGCGLAGFKEEEIKPAFWGAPFNVTLPEGW